MTDHDALLAAVKDRPDDDHPRLVFADRLEEWGDVERAEFIRVGCELARLTCEVPGYCSDGSGKCGACERMDALKRREYDLLSKHWRSWWQIRPSDEMEHPDWRRGFVESVACTAAAWLAHGDAVTAAHPVRTVRLMTRLTSDELLRTFNEREPPPPIPDDGETTVRTDNAELRTLFAVWWPGIRFELPAEQTEFQRQVNEILRRSALEPYVARAEPFPTLPYGSG